LSSGADIGAKTGKSPTSPLVTPFLLAGPCAYWENAVEAIKIATNMIQEIEAMATLKVIHGRTSLFVVVRKVSPCDTSELKELITQYAPE
jgi:hypothetical protein